MKMNIHKSIKISRTV